MHIQDTLASWKGAPAARQRENGHASCKLPYGSTAGGKEITTLKTTGELVAGVRKIAVLRANGLGDFIFALPALDALRAAYPESEIVLLGKQWHQDFLRGRPGPIDRVEVVPPYPGITADEGTDVEQEPVERFLSAMQEERFDLAVQIHGGGANSNPFTKRLGARITVGLQDRGAPPLDRTVPYIYFQREPLRFLEVVGAVGAPPTTIEPRLGVTCSDRAEADAVLPPTDAPLAVIHPGAGAMGRRWPAEKFAAVADALSGAGAEIALTGTEAEREIVEATARCMRAPAHDLTAQLSLGGLTGLLSRATLAVTNDTGPHHLAAAVGTATVGVYWCFNLINADPLTRRLHRPVVSWRLDCPLCGQSQVSSSCGHRVSFVADVPVEDVAGHALDLLRLVTGRDESYALPGGPRRA